MKDITIRLSLNFPNDIDATTIAQLLKSDDESTVINGKKLNITASMTEINLSIEDAQ